MTTVEKQLELKNKILYGLEITYKELIEFKKSKKSQLVVMREGKIVKLKPEQITIK